MLVLSNPSSYHITIEVFSTDGTATGKHCTIIILCYNYYMYIIGGGIDYDSGPYNVTFPPGNTVVTFDIPVIYDKIKEDNENFTLSVSPQLPPLISHDDVIEAIIILRNIDCKSI